MPPVTLGLQLWTLRHKCEADFFGTLEAVARGGWKFIEPYEFYGADVRELARVLDSTGLALCSSHVSLELLMGDLDRVMDEHELLGCRRILCPWLEEKDREGDGAFERIGRILRPAGERLAARGFELGYHNHEFEFTLASNPDGLSRILAAAEPYPLFSQLDTYWVSYAGLDAVEYMRGLGPRLKSVHLKDGDPAAGTFSPVGKGRVGMERIIPAALDMGVNHFVVEQDETDGDPLDACKESLAVLAELGLGVE